MKKKILVTGAEGFLGHHLINHLKKQKIFGMVKKLPKKKIKKVTYFKCDIQNKKKIKNIIRKIKPDIIFHLAAKSHPLFSFKYPSKTISVNVLGTINLLQNLVELKYNPKIIIACSSAQYGTRLYKELPLNEKSSLKPDHIYGLSKLFQKFLGDQFYQMFKLKIINATIFNTSGPGKKNDVFNDFSKQYLNQINKDKTVKILCGNISNKRDFLHYDDTVRALDIISRKGKVGENYNISTGKLIKIKSLIDYIKEKSSKKIEAKQRNYFFRAYDEKYISGDSKKLKKIGWKPKKNYKNILDEMCKFKN